MILLQIQNQRQGQEHGQGLAVYVPGDWGSSIMRKAKKSDHRKVVGLHNAPL